MGLVTRLEVQGGVERHSLWSLVRSNYMQPELEAGSKNICWTIRN